MDAVELSLFASRINAVCDEMGATLRRAAFSPNIRDRLDFSCAVFDGAGELCAQAAHIPVHLGSMAFAMGDLVRERSWQEGDMLIVNDPFRGGTHLPDVTLVAPVIVTGRLVGFVANRAHHADIGSDAPGSMPVVGHIDREGLLIEPTLLLRGARIEQAPWARILDATHNRASAEGDLSAQISANRVAIERLRTFIAGIGIEDYLVGLAALNDYGERMAAAALGAIPAGDYVFEDVMDDDGQGRCDIPLRVRVSVKDGGVGVDFSGTAGQVAGNINCPLPVTAAAVYYIFRCLMDPRTPACAGTFRALRIHAPCASLLNAQWPAAVSAGNVETSSRVVDLLLGALAGALPEAVAAASQGTMNNIAMGARTPGGVWDYYETIAGGMGAGRYGGGLNAVQTHMTNTRNTPVETLETNYPLRIRRYAIRRGSGGSGQRSGGDGLIREYEFLAAAQLTLLSERRRHAPWGLLGGTAGARGENRLNGELVAPKCSLYVVAGDRLKIATPGGGGYGV